MAIRALVFDFDGLILDTEVPEFTTVREVFADHGQELTLELWAARVGRVDHAHWMDWLEELRGEPLEDRDGVRARRVERHHALIADNDLLPGVVPLLDAAADRSVPAAVASSSSLDWVGGHLERLGILGRFDAVVTRESVERSKPWPDAYLEACRSLDAEPADAVAFEDSHNGSLAAKAAGLYCVAVPNAITRDHDFDHVDWVVDSLAEVSLDALDARHVAPDSVGS